MGILGDLLGIFGILGGILGHPFGSLLGVLGCLWKLFGGLLGVLGRLLFFFWLGGGGREGIPEIFIDTFSVLFLRPPSCTIVGQI